MTDSPDAESVVVPFDGGGVAGEEVGGLLGGAAWLEVEGPV